MHGLPSSAAAYQQKNHLAFQQSITAIIAAADATKTNLEITPNQPGLPNSKTHPVILGVKCSDEINKLITRQ